MPQKTSPFLEGKWGWDLGENLWNTGADENWLKFSYMFDANVDAIVATLPVAVNGEAYFLTTDNRIYFVVEGTYYSTPVPKWFKFTIKSSGSVYQFDGTTAVQIDSPIEIDNRLDAAEGVISGLGTAAFQNSTSFASQTAFTNKTSGYVNVAEYALGNGTDESVQIQAAVTAAFTSGAPLFWPPKEYTISSAITNFYNVLHIGKGTVKDGSSSYPIASSPGTSTTLYVSTTGDNSNIGVNSSRPFASIQSAVNAIPTFAEGTWTISVAAGTYIGAVAIRKNYSPTLNIIIQGPPTSPGGQTAILDGAGLGSVIGIYCEDLAKITLSQLKVQNFSSSGTYFMGCGFAQMNNVNVFASGSASSECVRASHSVLVANGCQVDGNAVTLNGMVCYHGFMSVLGASTVTGCIGAGALYAESSGGHFDTNIVSNCPRGVYALQGGFPTISGGSISNASSAAIESDQGSYITIPSNPTFSGNTVNIRQTINTGISGKIRDDATRTALFANNDVLEIITQGGGAFIAQFNNSGLTIPSGTWNGRHFILGTYHLWVTSTGVLRIKNGAPTSETDGTVVGAQT